MRTLPPDYLTHLGLPATMLCQCVRITRKDGAVFGFTDHDRAIEVEGVVYVAVRGVTMSAITTSSGLNVDTLELSGFLGVVTEVAVKAGVWDNARLDVFETIWVAPSIGVNKQRRGIAGEIKFEAGTQRLTIEVRSMLQLLQAPQGEACSRFCKADLYDARCKVVPTEGVFQFSDVVVANIVSLRELELAGLTQPDDFFANGSVVGTEGANAGITREISSHSLSGTNALVKLYEALPYSIIAGVDAFTIRAGCMKRFGEDCIAKFDNKENFRGFPHLPGPDAAFEGP